MLSLALVLISTSCKKKPEPTQQPTVSPTPTEPYGEPKEDNPEPDDPSAYGPPKGGPDPAEWVHREPDLGPKPDAKGAVVKKPAASDADIAAQKEAEDKEATEKAIEASVNGALGRVKACLNQHKAAPGQYTLSVRVHRSGRVLSSSVSGLGGEANRCVQGVLSGLKVNGVLTDTITVKRQLKNW